MSDAYTQVLLESCESIEDAYGLSRSIDGKPLRDQGAEFIAKELNKELKTLDVGTLKDREFRAFDGMTLIAHIMARTEFFELLRVDFGTFPKDLCEDLESVLSHFVSRQSLNTKYKKKLNIVVDVLDRIDRKHLELRFELPYRMVRLFLVLVTQGNVAEGGVLASFLLKQLERSR